MFILSMEGNNLMINIVKSTKYCNILKQAKIQDGENVYAIEEIYIKELKRIEVRFAWYKINGNGEERYIMNALDLEKESLFELLNKAIEVGIFTKEQFQALSN